MAKLATDPDHKLLNDAFASDDGPTIEEEKDAALTAINATADAQHHMAGLLVGMARKNYPKDWRQFRSTAFSFRHLGWL